MKKRRETRRLVMRKSDSEAPTGSAGRGGGGGGVGGTSEFLILFILDDDCEVAEREVGQGAVVLVIGKAIQTCDYLWMGGRLTYLDLSPSYRFMSKLCFEFKNSFHRFHVLT